MNHFIFSAEQLGEFKQLAHEARNDLRPFVERHRSLTLPQVQGMLDILAAMLGYEHHQDFIRASKGHRNGTEPAVSLTAERFWALSERFEPLLASYGFSKAHCRWVIAGWFVRRPDGALDDADIALLKNPIKTRRPFPVSFSDRERGLIDLECMEPQTEQPNGDPTLEPLVIGLRPTKFGQWVGARAEARLKAEHGRKLTHSDMAYWTLPAELCLLRLIEVSHTVAWGTAKSIDAAAGGRA